MIKDTIQLELKNVLFSKNVMVDSGCEFLELDNGLFSKRNGLDEFLKELSKYYRIAIWSCYEIESHNELVKYISHLGIDIRYTRSLEDCTLLLQEGLKFTEKRLKRLNQIGIDISNLVTIEINAPLKEDYGNHFLISEFVGQEDEELFNSISKLKELS